MCVCYVKSFKFVHSYVVNSVMQIYVAELCNIVPYQFFSWTAIYMNIDYISNFSFRRIQAVRHLLYW